MASCIKNVRTKTYYNWITFFQVMIKNGVCFLCPAVYFGYSLAGQIRTGVQQTIVITELNE